MEEKNNIMYKLSEFIVDKRRIFCAAFIVAVVISLFTMTKVSVNNSISSYLPGDTETKQSLDIMDREFVTYASTDIMVSNVTYEKAERIREEIEDSEGIKSVTFENDEDHYKNSSALFEVTLDESNDLDRELAIIDALKEKLSDYDAYFYSSSIDDTAKTLDEEMRVILILAAAVIIAVLLFTSQSLMEVPVYLITFVSAAALNMGTNIFLGEISFITKSVAVVLQLALAIDYSIILSHRFTEEKKTHNAREAIVTALSKAIIEISSSSLTTISGLAALMLMHLKIGMDLGVVMCKAIVCSLISVFLLMPGLLYMFSDIIDKTRHKNFVPSIMVWCRGIMKLRYVIPVIFALICIIGAVLSSNTQYSFDSTENIATRPTEKSIAKDKIEGTFGERHMLALVVPAGNHADEKRIADEVMKNENVTSVQSLSTTEIDDGYGLTDAMTPREFADMMDIDYSVSKLLFQAYGVKNERYEAVMGDISEFRAEPIDLVFFMKECMDKGVIELDEEQTADIDDMIDQLNDAKKQLEGENYARIIFNYTSPVESGESKNLVNSIRSEALKYYPEAYVSSNTTSAMDLEDSFAQDNSIISMITILAVFVILLFTFKSFGLPLILVAAIQGSIWINFSVPYITGERIFFLGYLIVSSIQMGATIDYAIVIANRYMTLRSDEDKVTAAARALDLSFPTVLTSGSILTIAGLLLGVVSTNPMISSLGTVLGRGTFISIIVVLTALPLILVLTDTFIQKSEFKLKTKREGGQERKKFRSQAAYVDGRIQGYVNGYIIGELHGVIRGDIDARIDIKSLEQNEGGLLEENTQSEKEERQ